MKQYIYFAAVAFLFQTASFGQNSPAKLLGVEKIWDQAPHSAFTDLAFWNDQFVCAFREGRGHVSSDGKIRVLTSPDGKTWNSSAVVSLDKFDLRDAGLSVTPDGRLMLIGGASPRSKDGDGAPTGSFVSFSDDAITWSKPQIVSEPGRWLWRVTWHDGKAYGIDYSAGSKYRAASLLVSDDGAHYRELAPRFLDQGWPTESVIRFNDDGTMYCLARRDGKAPSNTAMFASSRPPYTDWKWHDLGVFFGGPNFIQIPGGKWIAAGRIVGKDGPKTELAWLDVEHNKLTPFLRFPSGGDTSYPGLVWHDDTLWVSYYSSHEGKTSIYLARVQLD